MPEPTNAELNAIIAKWVGWKARPLREQPPAYASDLNVWDDIYKQFRADRWTTSSAFLKQLLADLDVDDVTGDYGWLTMIFATALQRARALGRVIEEVPR